MLTHLTLMTHLALIRHNGALAVHRLSGGDGTRGEPREHILALLLSAHTPPEGGGGARGGPGPVQSVLPGTPGEGKG